MICFSNRENIDDYILGSNVFQTTFGSVPHGERTRERTGERSMCTMVISTIFTMNQSNAHVPLRPMELRAS